MFDLIFSFSSALKQVAFFVGAIFCWGTGGFLVGNAIYWRLHAVRVQGEVIGVRRYGNYFNSVYRYASPAGETVEATSLEGSTSLRGRQTGRLVPLWVIPEKPQEVQEAGNHAFTLVGVLLLGLGVALFWVGTRVSRTGPMTWVVGAWVLVHLLLKLRRLVAPRDKTLPRSGWQALPALLKAARASAASPTRDASPVQRAEELAELPEFRNREMSQRSQLGRLAPILLLAGVGMLALAVYESRALLRLEATGLRTSGRVTSLSASQSSDGGTTYYPRVSYKDSEGRTVVFRDSTGSNPPLYHVGQPVTVLYPPDEPGRAIIDRGVWNWLPSLLLYLLGAGSFAGGFAVWRVRPAEALLAAES